MGACYSESKNSRVNEADTKHASLIPESASDALYNSIVKIVMGNNLQGTGFFMKINIKGKQVNCLFTCNHVINEKNIEAEETFDIFYGKINQEINKKIKLNKKVRMIKTFEPPKDITLVEIIESDLIPDNKYLFPDYNYKNGFEYYKGKNFYMAGYPKSIEKNDERCICSGRINEINGFDFEHTLDSRSSSSGSPICLIDNKCVVGIHKQGDRYRPVNYGTFLGIILDNLQNNEAKNIIEENEEHEFHFKNIKNISQIKNKENIQSILLLDEKYISGKDKFLIVKSENQVSIYYLESKKLKFRIKLDSKINKSNENEEYHEDTHDITDKLEVIDTKYYKNLPPNSFLLITKKYKIEIDLDKNKGKIIDSIYNYFNIFKSKNSSIKIPNDIINSGEFVSNLDVFSHGKNLEIEGDKDYIYNNFIYFFSKSFHLQKKIEKFDSGRTFDINGKYFIHYFYMRGGSTTSVYDINNNYQQVYEKRYYHQGNLTFIADNKYLILPPSPDGYDNEFHLYTFVNLENFSDKKIDASNEVHNYGAEPMIVHKFKENKYLQCESSGFWIGKKTKWTIIEEKEGKFIQIEEINNDEILGDNPLFFKKNEIITWNFNEKIIKFLSY